MAHTIVETSVQARDFARRFLEVSSLHNNDFSEKKEGLSVKPASGDERIAARGGDIHSEESTELQKVSMIDYGKWERFAKIFNSEGKIDGKNSKSEEEEEEVKSECPDDILEYKSMFSGCNHDHSKERSLYAKSTDEKLEAASMFKCEGNKAFQDKNYGLAAVNYRKALIQFDYAFPSTQEEQKRFDELKLSCHTNLAACKLHIKNYPEVILQCRQALEIDPQNCKALYRKGLALLCLDEFNEAEQELRKALEIEKENSAIMKAIAEMNRKRVQYQKKIRRQCEAFMKPVHDRETKTTE